MPGPKISVLLFSEDAALAELLKYLLAMQSDIEVLAIADNVRDLYAHIRNQAPDVVTIIGDPDASQMIAEDIYTNAPGVRVITWDSEQFRQDAEELADGMTMSGRNTFAAPNQLADAIRAAYSDERGANAEELDSDEDYFSLSPDTGREDIAADEPQPQPKRGRMRGNTDFEAQEQEKEASKKGLFGKRQQAQKSAPVDNESAKMDDMPEAKPREKMREEEEIAEAETETAEEILDGIPNPMPDDEAPEPEPAPPPPRPAARRGPYPGGAAVSRGLVNLGGNVSGDANVGGPVTIGPGASASDAQDDSVGGDLNVAGGDVVHGDKVAGDKIIAENVTIVNREEALKYETQARRFDAAFPERVEHKKTATLWVGVAMPDAPPPFEGAVAATATKGPTADIKLPVNPETGKAEEVQIDVEVRAPQYDPSVDRATLTVYPDGTADKVKFLLEAQDEGEGVIMVRFYLDKKRLGEIELASVVAKARAGMSFGLKLQVATVYFAFGVG